MSTLPSLAVFFLLPLNSTTCIGDRRAVSRHYSDLLSQSVSPPLVRVSSLTRLPPRPPPPSSAGGRTCSERRRRRRRRQWRQTRPYTAAATRRCSRRRRRRRRRRHPTFGRVLGGRPFAGRSRVSRRHRRRRRRLWSKLSLTVAADVTCTRPPSPL